MGTGTIEGAVRDKQHAKEILAAILPLLPSGAVVRVTPKLVKVDMTRVRGYPETNADAERVSEDAVTGGLS